MTEREATTVTSTAPDPRHMESAAMSDHSSSHSIGPGVPRAPPVPPVPPMAQSDLMSPVSETTLQGSPEDREGFLDLTSTPSRSALHSSKAHLGHKQDLELLKSQSSLGASHREYIQSTDSSPQLSHTGLLPHFRVRRRRESDMTASTAPYAEHGALIDRQTTAEEKKPMNAALRWPRYRRVCREAFSEYLGTFILVMFGDGSVAQVVLSNDANGNYQSISWGWGLGVMLGVYTSGISGAHINPAVTLANCVYRGFPWRKFPVYVLSQVTGAMTASAVVYGNYKSAIQEFEGGAGILTVPGYSKTATAGIFCTYPQPFMTNTGQFFSEFIASALLMFLIYALKDDGNLGAGKLVPLGLFFVIFGIGACFGWETGYAINLARDFGPRLVSYMIGYGPNVWRAGNYYFWVPMVAPFFGTVFGGFLYDMFLFTGESPINTPYLGLYRFVPSLRRKYEGVSFSNSEKVDVDAAIREKDDSPV